MAALAAKRRSELEARLGRLAAARDALVTALDAAGQSGDGSRHAGGGGHLVISDAEWQSKYESVRGQLGRFKAAKKELAALEAEAFVLARTLGALGAPLQPVSSAAHPFQEQLGGMAGVEPVHGAGA
jgi:hypothetical protein